MNFVTEEEATANAAQQARQHAELAREAENETAVYRQMAESLQFELLKLSNDFQRTVKEKEAALAEIKKIKSGGDGSDGGGGGGADPLDAAGALPAAQLKERNAVLSDQVTAWEGKVRGAAREDVWMWEEVWERWVESGGERGGPPAFWVRGLERAGELPQTLLAFGCVHQCSDVLLHRLSSDSPAGIPHTFVCSFSRSCGR